MKCSDKRLRKGSQHPLWRGGKTKHGEGYYLITIDSFEKGKRKRVLEHRFVMENHLGRKLGLNEVVHHKNGIRTDNRIENLEILEPSSHMSVHNMKRWDNYYSKPQKCPKCKKMAYVLSPNQKFLVCANCEFRKHRYPKRKGGLGRR